MKRFYKEVSVGGDFSVLLDGKPIKTPLKAKLLLPTQSLAEAVAEEWRRQDATLVPSTMWLTKLANTTIDSAGTLHDEIVADLLGFGKSDLLCYRAIEPAELIEREQEVWDPLLDWAHYVFGARLKTTYGVGHIEQDPEAIATFDRVLRVQDGWALTGLQTATTITGSLVLAFAIAKGRLTPAEAFALSRIDETFQAEKWGADPEAEKRARLHAAELEMAGKFIALTRT
jgi:chaperone required for assembly of F1-ATPase